MPRNEIYRVLPGKNFTRFAIEVPVVLLGGPVKAYVENLRKLVIADFIVPENADVGNAVGSLVGKGIKRIEILIKTRFIPQSHEGGAEEKEPGMKNKESRMKNEESGVKYKESEVKEKEPGVKCKESGMNDEESETNECCIVEDGFQYENKKEFIVFSPSSRKKFEIYSEALEYAEKLGRQLIMDYMISAGLGKENIRIDISRRHLSPGGWKDIPLETKLIFVGIGIPKNAAGLRK
jgi:N-methylhydantoinase A/oxoprolinase/acetone carboxylase beta subunit